MREYRLATDLSWLPERKEGISNTGNDEGSILSTSLTETEKFAYAARKHWSIESQLHWCLNAIL